MTAQPANEQSTLKTEPNVATQEPAQTVTPPVTQDTENVLYSWKAPARPFKKRDRDFWATTIAIAGVFGIILFLVEGVMPVILIISVVFLFYVLSTVPPEEIENKITSLGLRVAEKLTPWDLITRYWFAKRFDVEVIVFELAALPGRLELVILPQEKEALKKALEAYLAEEPGTQNSYDKVASWFSQKSSQT